MGLKMTTTICLMFVFMIQVAAAVHSTGIQVQIRGHTGFFDRNVIFELLSFQPKNQYFSEIKYDLKRLLWDILKNKCSL